MYPVELRTEQPFKIAALSHTGPYVGIGKVFDKVDKMIDASGVGAGASIGIYYDNPQDTPLEELRAHAGREVRGGKVPEGMETVEIDGGPVAVLTHVGHFSGLPAAWHYMFSVALPERDLEIRPGQMFERYLNNTPDTPIEEVVTEICVPVTPA